MKKLREFLYGSEKIELVFDVPIQTAVERLNANVSKISLSRFKSETMVGKVNRETIKIERVIPMRQNSFKPIFVGSFSANENKTILSGVFRFNRSIQVFMTLWFGFLSLWTVMASVEVFVKSSEVWFLPLIGIPMLCFGIGLVKVCKWFSKNDKQWLKESISNAVNKH